MRVNVNGHNHRYHLPPSYPPHLRICRICAQSQRAVLQNRAIARRRERLLKTNSSPRPAPAPQKQPRPSQEEILEYTKSAAAACSGKNRGLNNYTMVYLDKYNKLNSKNQFSAPCYAYVKGFTPNKRDYRGNSNGIVESLYFCDNPFTNLKGNNTKRSSSLAPHERAYIHYIINESPYAPAFITKNVDEAVDAGVIMSLDFSASFVVGAAILLRFTVEYRNRPAFWYLAKDHMHPALAVFLSQVTNYGMMQDNKGVKNWTANPGYWNSSHSCFQDSMKNIGLRRYLTGDLSYDKLHQPFRINADYGNLQKPWGMSSSSERDLYYNRFDPPEDLLWSEKYSRYPILFPDREEYTVTDPFGKQRKLEGYDFGRVKEFVRNFAKLNHMEDIL